MAKPHITASASKAMRSNSQHRKLVLIDLFNGYECSHCKCRFPESALPKGWLARALSGAYFWQLGASIENFQGTSMLSINSKKSTRDSLSELSD
jgi:hypothetical protein